jgi:hypothetical protein
MRGDLALDLFLRIGPVGRVGCDFVSRSEGLEGMTAMAVLHGVQ